MTHTTPPEQTTSGDRADFGELVGGVRRVFESRRTRPLPWRRAQLKALLAMLDDQQEAFVAALAEDLGRARSEALSSDIGHARLQIRHVLKNVETWSRPRRVSAGMLSMPAKVDIIPEPLGVALVISPWNYPVQLLLEPMAAAIAAGNCVIAKPSEVSPATTAELARWLPRYLDDEAVVVVEGGVPETTALLEERLDHIFFTGSTSVGRIVMAAAAAHLTPVTLELGGKSPAIVTADANVEVAARRIAWGRFLNAGQTCIAPDYVLADSAIVDSLVDRIGSSISSFYGNDPSTSDDFARIVNARHLTRLTGLLASAGGTVAHGGQIDAENRYVAPTVVVDPDPDSPLMTEEIFGPILPVVAVDDVDSAVDFVNRRPKPLALYAFTSSTDTADSIIDRTSSGGAAVNHCLVQVLPEHVPFGGVGASGMGAYHGKAGFDAFTHHKPVMRKPTRPDPSVQYPPYTSFKQKLIARAFR